MRQFNKHTPLQRESLTHTHMHAPLESVNPPSPIRAGYVKVISCYDNKWLIKATQLIREVFIASECHPGSWTATVTTVTAENVN